MNWKQKARGSLIGFIGFMLSPLSWWNDFFLNIPLALAFGWLVSLFYRPAFEASVIVGYWLTNVLGFVLMHKGAKAIVTAEGKPYTKRDFIRDLLISCAYTLVVVALIKLKIVQPFVGLTQ